MLGSNGRVHQQLTSLRAHVAALCESGHGSVPLKLSSSSQGNNDTKKPFPVMEPYTWQAASMPAQAARVLVVPFPFQRVLKVLYLSPEAMLRASGAALQCESWC